MEALWDIADAVRHLRSDECFVELEACVKALEEKYEVLAAVYEAEMAEKVMVEAEDVEMMMRMRQRVGSDGMFGSGGKIKKKKEKTCNFNRKK